MADARRRKDRRRLAGGVCLLCLALALSGCGKGDADPGPGGVTMGEARALDEAAQMLDARQPPPGLYAPSRPAAPARPEPSPSAAPRP